MSLMRLAPLALLSSLGLAGTARAQASVSAEVALNSQYVWRGVTSTNRFVIQPDLSISAPVRALTFTLGAWANIEPARYDSPGDISSLGGLPGPLVTQSELYAELSGAAFGIDAALGAQVYLYPHVNDLADYNTTELYATASVESFVSPSLTVAYDVARIRGAYMEAGLARAITGERRGTVTLNVAAGFSAGQAEDPRGRDLAYFERDGLTHVDASATATLQLGRFTLMPEAHVVVAYDPLATVTAPDVSRRTKLWFGTTVSWSSGTDR